VKIKRVVMSVLSTLIPVTLIKITS